MRSDYSLFLVFTLVVSAAPLHAAEWRECEKAKLQQLRQTEKARVSAPKKSHGKHRARTNSSYSSSEDLETWLWKNCRDYSYELRSLEQQRM